MSEDLGLFALNGQYDTQNCHKVNQKRFYKQVFNEKFTLLQK